MADGKTRKVTLTDRTLKTLKPAPDGQPYDVRDTVVPGLRVRVMGSGKASFVISPMPVTRAIAPSDWD
jgi:hypothetical protein